MQLLTILLAALPSTLRGPADPAYKGRVPKRALFLHPDAAASLGRIEAEGGAVYTDIFRGAEGQLSAKRRNPTATKAVSLSGHGFGLSKDLDVAETLRLREWTYEQLLDEEARHGWHCHRRDRKQGSESWHFNYLGTAHADLLALAKEGDRSTWDDPVEALVQRLYGPGLAPSLADLPALLARAGAASVTTFQKAWDLRPDGIAGPRTLRTLAYVTADLDVRTLVG